MALLYGVHVNFDGGVEVINAELGQLNSESSMYIKGKTIHNTGAIQSKSRLDLSLR